MQTPDRQFEEIRRLGSFDGAGAYSIDLTLPLERFEAEQRFNPTLYYLHLVAAGVARGSDTMEIRTESRRAVFKFDRGVPFEDLQELVPSLFLTRPSPARVYLRELALGIGSARQLGLTEVTLSSWLPQRSEGVRMEIAGTIVKATPLAQPPWPGGQELTRLELKERRARREFFGLGAAPRTPEDGWDRVRWAPIPIIRDGSALNRSLVFEPCKLFCLIGNPPWAPGESHYRRLSTDGSFTGYLALGVPRKGGLTIVSDGVAFPAIDLGLKGTEALVYTSGMVRQPDLSDLVRNPQLETMIEQVRGKVRDLLVATAADPQQVALVRELLVELPQESPPGLGLSAPELLDAFKNVPFFTRRDGSPVTPAELADEPVVVAVGTSGEPLQGWNPVVRDPFLDRLFPDRLLLPQELAEVNSIAQVALTEPPGVACLTDEPGRPPRVLLTGSDEETSQALPPGFCALVRAGSLEETLPVLKGVLPQLYQQLVDQGDDRSLVNHHLLALFRNLVDQGASLRRMLSVPKLRALAERLSLAGEDGEVSLVEVVESGVDCESLAVESEVLEQLRRLLAPSSKS